MGYPRNPNAPCPPNNPHCHGIDPIDAPIDNQIFIAIFIFLGILLGLYVILKYINKQNKNHGS